MKKITNIILTICWSILWVNGFLFAFGWDNIFPYIIPSMTQSCIDDWIMWGAYTIWNKSHKIKKKTERLYKTYTKIDNNFYKDKTHIYYCQWKVTLIWADPKTFKLLLTWSNWWYLAKDKNNIYLISNYDHLSYNYEISSYNKKSYKNIYALVYYGQKYWWSYKAYQYETWKDYTKLYDANSSVIDYWSWLQNLLDK